MLRLAQAASSEYYSAWGVPPNQRRTGASPGNPGGNMDGELNIVPFYGGWEYVFRAKDARVSEYIAWLMEGAVENGTNIGYSQWNVDYPREGVFDALFGMVDPDTRKIKIPVNCDCTSLLSGCVFSAGRYDPKLYVPELRNMWSGNERELLMETGAFVELTDSLLLELGTGLRRGDILLKTGHDNGHTAVAIDSDDHRDTFPVRITGCAFSRVRSGPGVEFDTLEVVETGTILPAEGTAADSDRTPWFRVLIDGKTGYTSSVYAERLPEGRCTGDTWLRKEAGTKGAQIIVIPKCATVYLTGEKKTALSGVIPRKWYGAIYGGHQGWASGLYIKH